MVSVHVLIEHAEEHERGAADNAEHVQLLAFLGDQQILFFRLWSFAGPDSKLHQQREHAGRCAVGRLGGEVEWNGVAGSGCKRVVFGNILCCHNLLNLQQ